MTNLFCYQIRTMEKKLKELKLKTGGTAGTEEMLQRVRCKLTTLENRLVHVLKTYNDSVGTNMSEYS